MKNSIRGFSLFEILIATGIVAVIAVIAARQFTSSGSSEKRLSNRVALIDMKQQITSYMQCNQTLKDELAGSSLPLPCSGKIYPLRTKSGKTLTLKSKTLLAVARCKENPITNERGLVIGLQKTGISKDAETKRDLGDVKKRGRLIRDDLFDGNAYFCGRYFEPVEEDWKIAGTYTLNTYESDMSKPADRTCNQSEIYTRCDKIFGGSCKSKCKEKERIVVVFVSLNIHLSHIHVTVVPTQMVIRVAVHAGIIQKEMSVTKNVLSELHNARIKVVPKNIASAPKHTANVSRLKKHVGIQIQSLGIVVVQQLVDQ